MFSERKSFECTASALFLLWLIGKLRLLPFLAEAFSSWNNIWEYKKTFFKHYEKHDARRNDGKAGVTNNGFKKRL